MIEYLSGTGLTRPTLIDKAPTERKTVALVTAPFDAGTITLAGPDGDVTLLWNHGEGTQARGIPAGAYRLRTTRVELAQGKKIWFISSTGAARDVRDYKQGATTSLPFPSQVHFTCRAKRKGKALSLGMGIKDASGQGLSIYRGSKRLTVGYAVLDAKGKELATGTMNFG